MLDTPNNLFKQLKDKASVFSRFIGAKLVSGGKYELIVE